MDTDSVQGSLEGFLGSSVEHFGADTGGVGCPGDEYQLGGGSSVRGGKVEVNESVAAVVVGECGAKVVKGFGPLTLFFDDNGLLVFNGVDNVTELFALLQLEIVKGGNDVVGYFNSRALWW